MEVELTRAKMDLMSLDSQLMNAIQQKVDLSQQLEQWQEDMHRLLEITMTRRVKQEAEAAGSCKNSPKMAKRSASPFSWN